MRILTIIVLIVLALLILLPILSGNASIPEDISAVEIGDFVGGCGHYWVDATKVVFSHL
uniref:Uncharacterized protein n=2 Tax=Methanomicrobia TaxID=224756 RepID=A0A7H1KPA1_9EURY|nr:hypothetical protein KICHMFME_00003 [Methanosarcinales archaeon ANME-1 ERB7]QNT35765.1 hypothetical protein MCFLDGBP_00013 [uncultured Methanosarcinales archaeon]